MVSSCKKALSIEEESDMRFSDLVEKLISSKERLDIYTVGGEYHTGTITKYHPEYIIVKNITSMSNATHIIQTDKISSISYYGRIEI